jgi:hypothetical protein
MGRSAATSGTGPPGPGVDTGVPGGKSRWVATHTPPPQRGLRHPPTGAGGKHKALLYYFGLRFCSGPQKYVKRLVCGVVVLPRISGANGGISGPPAPAGGKRRGAKALTKPTPFRI